MSQPIDLHRLKDFFEVGDIEWKPLAFSKDGKRALAAAYVTNRAIMDRLDEVCGPANWQNAFQPGPDGGVLCGLSVRLDDQWVTKWDGAENTDIEPVKGGLSSAMRRAAVHWGIGRYLYRLPTQWVAVDNRGRFREDPVMPAAFLPPASGDGAPARQEASPRLVSVNEPAATYDRPRQPQRVQPETRRPDAPKPRSQGNRPQPRRTQQPPPPLPPDPYYGDLPF